MSIAVSTGAIQRQGLDPQAAPSLCGFSRWPLQCGGFREAGLLTRQLGVPNGHVPRDSPAETVLSLWLSFGSRIASLPLQTDPPRFKGREHGLRLLMDQCQHHIIRRVCETGHIRGATSGKHKLPQIAFRPAGPDNQGKPKRVKTRIKVNKQLTQE